ncbi:MAG TPA: alpha/beta fold hydrolase, partial [Jatrophihabitans sp.]|nr:alpha/beta fold hydrolase [Jatrophihabitans sp.]
MTFGQRMRRLGTRLPVCWLWRTRRRAVASIVVLAVLLAAGVTGLALSGSPTVRTSAQFIDGVPEGAVPVQLDTTLYLPARVPAPAILLAHGFGGSKADLAGQARSLAQHGYVVLAYSARGFGRSGGLIHLDSLDYEVADASRLVSWLQARPEVARAGGRPQIGVAGSSYGGALALMLGSTDPRIHAVAADITWNNLAHALFPNEGGDSPGVFKKLWAGYLFSAGFTSGSAGGSTGGSAAGADQAGGLGSDSGASSAPAADPVSAGACGRFAPQLCALYAAAAGGGPVDAAALQLLGRSSPATVLSRIKAPVLLTQGEQDSLFPLSEADANAREIAAAGAPVTVRWRAGGHDAPSTGDNVAGWQRQFF